MPSSRLAKPQPARRRGRPAPRPAESQPLSSVSKKPWRHQSRSAAETDRLGQALGASVREGNVVALYGELGTGKTTLVRGLAAGLGAPPGLVSSPTFVLVHEYRGRLHLAHADLYRIESESELRQVGLSDYLDGRHVVVVEWAERAGHELPDDRLEIRLRHRSRTTREMIVTPTGPASGALLSKARQRWEARDISGTRSRHPGARP